MTLTTYADTSGAFVNGVTALNAANMNAIRNFLIASGAMWDSNASWDGNGTLTLVGLTTGTGRIKLADPGAAQSLSNGSTITISAPWVKVTNSGNVTGIIMSTGSVAGQLAFVNNQSGSGTVTFAASGSNVRNGSNVTIGIGRVCLMIYDGSVWHPSPNS